MPVPVELLRFFEKMTPAAPAAGPSASLADFGDTEAGADIEAHPAAAEPGAIPSVDPTAIPPVEAISIPPLQALEIKVPHNAADTEHAVQP